jgi:outer membrane protein assembly factor BamE (lipoprotein component of BamABCDE complex)
MLRRLAVLLAAATFFGGCSSGPRIPEPAPGELLFLTQSYPLTEVLERSRQLTPEMTRKDVLALLGTPAFADTEGWDYVSHDVRGTPVFGPKCWRLRVSFVSGRFASSDLSAAPLSPGGSK